jgi:uncharacterized membrane protein
MSKTRLEAFSDGVIAILITIMVLELRLPKDTNWSSLEELWPVFASYAASFITLGIYWVNHHHLIHTIQNLSSGIMWANLHLLFWLSLIPFATDWMGENSFAQHTVIAYTALAVICGIAYYMLLTMIRVCNKDNEVLKEVLKKQSRKGIFSNLLNLASFILAFIHPLIALSVLLVVFITWFIPDRNIEKNIHQI